jgi:hypothetical protein
VDTWLKYWNNLKLQLEDGEAPDCFVMQCVEDSGKADGMSDVQGAFLAGSKSISLR